jgi:membrane-associated phospholipid phosphatase
VLVVIGPLAGRADDRRRRTSGLEPCFLRRIENDDNCFMRRWVRALGRLGGDHRDSRVARATPVRAALGGAGLAAMSAQDVRPSEDADRAQRRGTEVLLLVSAVVVLAVSAVPAQRGRVSGVERTVFRWVNDLPQALYGPVAVIMQLGNVLTVLVVAVIAVALRRYRLAIGLALAGLGAYAIAKFVKDSVKRGRPAALLEHVHQRGSHASGLGYVSGHAAVAFAVATVLTMWLGPKARVVVWTLAGLVAFGRMYVGAHLPLDVVGGAALGLACGAAVRLGIGARRHGWQRRPVPSSPSPSDARGVVPRME